MLTVMGRQKIWLFLCLEDFFNKLNVVITGLIKGLDAV